MGSLFSKIRRAVREERYVVGRHADERCEQRRITEWQLVAGLEDGILLEERLHALPNPKVVVRQSLADGTEVEVVWSWLLREHRAKLVTVYFRNEK